MAGRGRPSTSLTQEQLMALGVNSKEMQSVTNAPPPIFPPLFSKPVPLEVNGMNFLITQIKTIIFGRPEMPEITKYCGKKISYHI